jgi:hypothetical protein
MKRIARQIAMAAIVIVSAAASAQSGSGYDLHWNTIASGGGAMNGNGYSLNGSPGQSAVAVSCGASGYTLRSGWWAGIPEGDVIFRNGFDAGC